MEESVKAAALVESLDHVCVRYRLAPYAGAFKSLDLIPFEKNLFARLRQYQILAQYEMVILQRTLLSKFELSCLRKYAKRLVYDFDDAVWLRDSYAANGYSRKRRRRFDNMVKAADVMFAGNGYLAEACKGKASVVPTCVDVDDYRVSPILVSPTRKRGFINKMVWVGSSSTLKSLDAITSTLTAIGLQYPNITLKILCDRAVDYSPLTTINVPWALETEIQHITDSDIGIAVMPDDAWSRGKCGVKVLQYMAAGLPVIANPVGVHTEMVIPNETGFLASTTDEWLAAIERLQDPELRTHLGRNARKLVERRYSTAIGLQAWQSLALPRRMAC